MSPGFNKILETPLTKRRVKVMTAASGNTFGGRFWTDGKCEAPMLLDEPWLCRVPDGGELFWTDECREIAKEDPWEASKEFADIPWAEASTAEDYRRALATGIATTPEKERYLRTRLWWAMNDPARHGQAMAEADGENLRRLLELVDQSDPSDRLMAAELVRELGDFAQAAALLDFEFPEGYARAADFLRQLNEQKDRTVREIIFRA